MHHLELQPCLLGDRFDHQVGRDDRREIGIELDPVAGGVGMGLIELAALDRAPERGVEPAGRALDADLVDVAHHHRNAGDRHRLGDPGAHEAGADDGHRLDPRVTAHRPED